jgi:hypothetical protein
MRDGLADKRLGLWHLASILGCGAEGCQRSSGRKFPTVRGRLHLREKVHLDDIFMTSSRQIASPARLGSRSPQIDVPSFFSKEVM